jgi:hypothetical protein
MLPFGNKKKDLSKPRFNSDSVLGGALSWSVWLDDTWLDSRVDVYMALSTDTLVLVDALTREPVFAIPTSSILGWNASMANREVRKVHWDIYHPCRVLRNKEDTL